MMNTWLNGHEWVVFDIETTGLSPFKGDRMIEIAALKTRDGKESDTFYSLINPQRPISWGAFLVNGISFTMVEKAPVAEEILPSFLRFVGGAYLVGHNIKFDLKFLLWELLRIDEPMDKDLIFFDTVKMAKDLLPDLGTYRLGFLAYALSIEVEHQHRALADAQLTWDVFARLIEVAQRKGIEGQDILRRYGQHLGTAAQRLWPLAAPLWKKVLTTSVKI